MELYKAVFFSIPGVNDMSVAFLVVLSSSAIAEGAGLRTGEHNNLCCLFDWSC